MRASLALRRAALGAAVLCGLAACLDDRTLPTTPAAEGPLRLALGAQLVVAAPALELRVYYLRTDGSTPELLRQRVTLTAAGGGTQQVALTVDPGPCLADPRRLAASVPNGCVIGATVTTLNDGGAATDSTTVLPIEAAPGDARTLGGDLVVGQTGWKQISVGAFASCGLWRDGAVYCWGNGEVGQLGSPATRQTAPVRVPAPPRFAKVSAGLGSACALTTLGQAWCWGLDVYGGLGRGSVSTVRCASVAVGARAEVTGPLPCAAAPAPVVAAASGPLTFRDVSVGAVHTCGITAAGRAYCWGLDTFLGIGNPNANTETPIARPSPVVGARSFAAISAGAFHTCALTEQGAAFCWGANDFGELGAASLTGSKAYSPVPVAVGGGLAFRQISTGDETTCGVTLTDEAYCWGRNEQLQAGVDSRTSDPGVYPAPRRVALAQPVAQISTGWQSTCAVTRAGAGFCWGSHATGQLGIGATAPQRCSVGATTFPCSPLPSAVTGALTFSRIEVGHDAACGLTRAGVATCWGSDEFGQLGAGRAAGSAPSPTPVQVRTPTGG